MRNDRRQNKEFTNKIHTLQKPFGMQKKEITGG